jgi:tetratricopeptide (TPR) repeat protein
MFRLSPIVGFALACALSARAQDVNVSISSIESLIRSQQYDQALSTLKTALRGSPGDFKLWTLEGICLSLQGNDREALASFDHAIRISPDYTPALKGEVQINTRGEVLSKSKLTVGPLSLAHNMSGVFSK